MIFPFSYPDEVWIHAVNEAKDCIVMLLNYRLAFYLETDDPQPDKRIEEEKDQTVKQMKIQKYPISLIFIETRNQERIIFVGGRLP